MQALRNIQTEPAQLKKDYINNQLSNEPKTGVLFVDFVLKIITRKAKSMGESYKANYLTLIYHIRNFANINDANIYTNSVNEEFLEDFKLYLENQNLKKTYIKSLMI